MALPADLVLEGVDYFTPFQLELKRSLPGEDVNEPPARGLRNKARRRLPGGQKTRRLRRRTGSDPSFMGSQIRLAEVGHHSSRNRGLKPPKKK